MKGPDNCSGSTFLSICNASLTYIAMLVVPIIQGYFWSNFPLDPPLIRQWSMFSAAFKLSMTAHEYYTFPLHVILAPHYMVTRASDKRPLGAASLKHVKGCPTARPDVLNYSLLCQANDNISLMKGTLLFHILFDCFAGKHRVHRMLSLTSHCQAQFVIILC
jgi:hypothetical protein